MILDLTILQQDRKIIRYRHLNIFYLELIIQSFVSYAVNIRVHLE